MLRPYAYGNYRKAWFCRPEDAPHTPGKGLSTGDRLSSSSPGLLRNRRTPLFLHDEIPEYAADKGPGYGPRDRHMP